MNQKFEDLKSGDVIRNLTEQNQKLQQVKNKLCMIEGSLSLDDVLLIDPDCYEKLYQFLRLD